MRLQLSSVVRRFVVFSKRHEVNEARLRVFCMTDDKEDKTLENQEHFAEVAKSRDVEVLEAKSSYVEVAGNLAPVTKSGEQLSLRFHAFRENRLPFTVRVKDPHAEAMGRVLFMREPLRTDVPPQNPICKLNVALPDEITPEVEQPETVIEVVERQKKEQFLRQAGYGKYDTIHRADLRISDIGNLLGPDWERCALELGLDESDVNLIRSEYPDNEGQQAMVMLRLWLNNSSSSTDVNRAASGSQLEKALRYAFKNYFMALQDQFINFIFRACGREDIVETCAVNVEMVTDDLERKIASRHIMAEVTSGFTCKSH